MSFVEELRKRIVELRERVKSRPWLLREEEAETTAGGIVGGGRIIDVITERIDRFIAIAKERRPNIIPTVLERIRTYEPGKRIMELAPIPRREEAAQPPAEGRKILRE